MGGGGPVAVGRGQAPPLGGAPRAQHPPPHADAPPLHGATGLRAVTAFCASASIHNRDTDAPETQQGQATTRGGHPRKRGVSSGMFLSSHSCRPEYSVCAHEATIISLDCVETLSADCTDYRCDLHAGSGSRRRRSGRRGARRASASPRPRGSAPATLFSAPAPPAPAPTSWATTSCWACRPTASRSRCVCALKNAWRRSG